MIFIRDIPCPFCGAPAGTRCVAKNSGKHTSAYHRARVRAAKQARIEASKIVPLPYLKI